MSSKVALITGAAGGIGSACAGLFAAAGWRTIGVDNSACGRPSDCDDFIDADVATVEGWEAVSRRVRERFGRLDALINNAAVQSCKPVLETTVPEWDRIMAVNLRSSFLSVNHLHPLLKTGAGSIINVSSVHSVATSTNIGAYAASKGALTAFTRALAVELAADRIRVNAVLPGAVDTQMLRAGLSRGHLAGQDPKSLLESLGQRTPLGRVGAPGEIAQAILFLADPERSGFMTGQCMIIDGGATARLSTE